MTLIGRNFYEQDTVQVAKDLLGCFIVRMLNGKPHRAMIVETEAYTQNDPACHAYKGCTPRSATLFKQPGLSYVYLIYGMYHCLNFVTEKEGTAGAVLIRAVEYPNANGPGKLCRELNIDKTLHEVDVTCKKYGLWVEAGKKIPENIIITTTRIGIKKAADFPWRFYIKNSEFVSKP